MNTQRKVRTLLTPPATRTYAPMPEHKTAAAKKQREALRATTESHTYSNRDRRRRGVQ